MPPNIRKKTSAGLIVYCVNRSPNISGRHPSQSGCSSFWNVSEAEGLPGGGRRARACAVGCFKDAQQKYINWGVLTPEHMHPKAFPQMFHFGTPHWTQYLAKDF